MNEEKLKTESTSKLMTFEEYAEKEHDPVYVFEVGKDAKKITYFGVEHSNDPEKPMFAQIEEKFKEANPQIVFVEGMHFSPGSKEKLIEEMKQADSKKVIEEWGESGFAFKLAADAGIEVDSPEPSFEEEIQSLVDQGFNKSDIAAYYVYRQANSYHRMTDKSHFEESLISYIEHFKQTTKWQDFEYSLEHVKQIGKEIWGDRGDIAKDDSWRTDPVPYTDKKSALWNDVNRVSQQSSYFRDRFEIEKIREAMEKYDRIFIAFGSSHAFMQEAALREIFEKP